MKTTTLKITLFIATLVAISVFYACQKKDTGSTETKNETREMGIQNPGIFEGQLPDCEPDGRTHQISYEQGKDYIDRYQRAARTPDFSTMIFAKGGWTVSETFSREYMNKLITEPYFCKFRTYYGMDPWNVIHVILVGTNSLGKDIFSVTANPTGTGQDLLVPQIVLDNSVICQPYCNGVYITPIP
jgi:hypothetical protein